MSDLSNALKRFKANRKAAQSEDRLLTRSAGSEANEDNEVSNLVILYKAICDRRALSDESTKRMRGDFATDWDKLAEEKRRNLVEELLRRRLLPEIVGKALTIFKGKMTRLL